MNRKHMILPPTYFFIYFIAALILHFFFPVVQIISFPYNLLGVIFVIIGAVLNSWADYLFHQRGTTVQPFEKASALITEGPFSFSRNPMYLGFVASLLGVAIILGSIMPFIIPPIMFLTLNMLFIPLEEKSLQDTFGSSYQKYKSRVRKWL